LASNQHTGQQGELLAKEFLQRKGFEILELNWRHSRAEVDIICRKQKTLVFIEVKARRNSTFGQPEGAVNASKQKQMILAAEEYIQQTDHNGDTRFDVISIRFEGANPVIMHIEDAFYPYQQ
jgi:putative endonuclease